MVDRLLGGRQEDITVVHVDCSDLLFEIDLGWVDLATNDLL